MKYSYLLPTTLSLLSSALADWDPNTAGADYKTLTETGSPIGSTDATGTYGLILETFDASKQKRDLKAKVNKAVHKEAVDKRLNKSRKNKAAHKKSKNKAAAPSRAGKSSKAKDAAIARHKKLANKAASTVTGSYAAETTCSSYVITSSSSSCVDVTTTIALSYNTEYLVYEITDGQIQWATTQSLPANPVSTSTYQSCTTVPFEVTSAECSTSAPSTTAISQNDEGDDGQVYAYANGAIGDDDGGLPEICSSGANLGFTLAEGVLTDTQGRIGSIVSNYQFQFDGPPPQAGTIYAAGWSITDDYYLALGDQLTFYGCPQDDSYKIYSDSAYDNCIEVQIKVYQFDDSC